MGYDYSLPGYYFVTICTQHRLLRFGEIHAGKMHPNPAGKAVLVEWRDLNGRFKNVNTDACVVMPDHVHGILQICTPGTWDTDHVADHERPGDGRCGVNPAPTIAEWQSTPGLDGKLRPISLADVVAAFKSRCARAINQLEQSPGRVLWQRSYYDHIIRSEAALRRIRKYIWNNPRRWNPGEKDWEISDVGPLNLLE